MLKKHVIRGDFAEFEIHVRNKYGDTDKKLYNLFLEAETKIKFDAQFLIKKNLGSEFKLKNIEVREGSAIIVIAISTTYIAISRYKSFIESLVLLQSQLRKLVDRILLSSNHSIDLEDIIIDSDLTLLHDFNILEKNGFLESKMFNLLLLYVVSSNIIFIIGIMVLLLKLLS